MSADWKCPGCGYVFDPELVRRAEGCYAAAADPKLPPFLVHACGCRTLSRLDGGSFRALTPGELLVLEVEFAFVARASEVAVNSGGPDRVITYLTEKLK